MTLQSIRYTPSSRTEQGRATLEILNQLQLPHRTVYDDITSSRDAWTAIKTMRVRGAPAIAIVAALSIIIDLDEWLLNESEDNQDHQSEKKPQVTAELVHETIRKALDHLLTSRPTAVNLGDAVRKLGKILDDARQRQPEIDAKGLADVYRHAAEKMLEDDVLDNEAMGRHGADWIMKHTMPSENGRSRRKVSILTHCNTGSLATAGYGTALGVIRALHADSFLDMAYCTETRPYNQGSRLTAYELVHDKIPATLLTDSMAASLLQKGGSNHNLAAIVVGADRVAANGDTANKVGTYSLAVLAKYHGVKFLVAAPRTTIDLYTSSGEEIVIEERPGREMSRVTGARCREDGTVDTHHAETVEVAAPGIEIWNPAFDVTPAALIDAVVTERGVVEKGPEGVFSFEKIFDHNR
ncbi:MAG: hypothetical protein M1823_004534 [Watsoniomyces obsoletus]|nr:MAG: hypothetical protein M1823_004534 [Watsoniomyces obsoletus]